MEIDNTRSQTCTEGEKREYQTDDLIVYWDAKQCSHAGKCWQNLPQVFNPDKRPWITMAAATPEEIIKTIDTCPTDALKYQLKKGSKLNPLDANGPGSIDYKKEAVSSLKIKMVRNGPLLVDGSAQIFGADGNFIKESSHIVLCGCGRSSNRPLCDGTHMRQQ
jgi:uncharacterized Fe-S cluster protein YjdI